MRVSPTPRPSLPPGKTRYPLYRRLGGPQGRFGGGGNSRPHRDSIPDRPNRQLSRYTDWATRPTRIRMWHFKNWGTFKPKLYSSPLPVIQAYGTLLNYLIREIIRGSCIMCCAKRCRNNESSCLWNCVIVYCLRPKCDIIQKVSASVSVFRADLSRKENKNLRTRPLRGEWPVKFTPTCKMPSNITINYLPHYRN